MENTTVTPTNPDQNDAAFTAPQEHDLGIGETNETTTPDGANPLEDFFRVNGVDQEQPEPHPFDEVAQAVPEQGTPPAQETAPQDNDEKRYQYWQSEADKSRMRNKELEDRLQAIEAQQAQPQAVQQTIQEPEPDLSFPPPPSKPDKPRNFSREEAFSDPSSESGQYLDDVDSWRDDMDDYNRLHSEFNTALVEEERNKINEERQNIMRVEAQKQQYQQQMGSIANHLKTNYNASDEEVSQFVQVMDKPESVNVDNLFQLFRLQSGNAPAPGAKPITETAKSDSFEQMKRAQQVPTSMGVLPSSGNTQGKSEDNMMDAMVSEFNNRNPW